MQREQQANGPVAKILADFREFLQLESTSGILLLAAYVVAILALR